MLQKAALQFLLGRLDCGFAFPKMFFAELTAFFNRVEKFGDGFQKTRRPTQGSRKEFPRWKQRERGFP